MVRKFSILLACRNIIVFDLCRGLISVNHLLNITAEIDLSRAQSEVEEAVRKMTEETEQLKQQARTALKLGSKVEVSCGSWTYIVVTKQYIPVPQYRCVLVQLAEKIPLEYNLLAMLESEFE